MKNIFLLVFTFIIGYSNAQTKILFDATKAESAGNADWVIDADVHNLGFSSGPAIIGTGNESNPQRIPTPLQSGITSTTLETYWSGALSNWGIDCVKQGYVVETLPYNGLITYGQASNVQDLSNYKVFVIDEPNILFSASEKTAIITFVHNGGGLCIVADHTISDRNNDNVDSLQVLNDLMSSNSVQNNPFGIAFDLVDISQTSSNIASIATNPILHGIAGNVTQVKWSNGTTMTLNTSQNTSATGLVFKTGSSTTGISNVMCATATYLTGKVVAIGDSSITDDGTGDNNDVLYNGYTLDANGNHQRLLINSIIWLASSGALSTENADITVANFTIAPNPTQDKELKFNYSDFNNQPTQLIINDTLGRIVKTVEINSNENHLTSISLNDLNSGIYCCTVSNTNFTKSLKFILQ